MPRLIDAIPEESLPPLRYAPRERRTLINPAYVYPAGMRAAEKAMRYIDHERRVSPTSIGEAIDALREEATRRTGDAAAELLAMAAELQEMDDAAERDERQREQDEIERHWPPAPRVHITPPVAQSSGWWARVRRMWANS